MKQNLYIANASTTSTLDEDNCPDYDVLTPAIDVFTTREEAVDCTIKMLKDNMSNVINLQSNFSIIALLMTDDGEREFNLEHEFDCSADEDEETDKATNELNEFCEKLRADEGRIEIIDCTIYDSTTYHDIYTVHEKTIDVKAKKGK